MTLREASALLAVDERALARLAEDRRIPAIWNEREWVFSRKSLLKWRQLQARGMAGP
jgi:hypothetical protein